MLHAIPASQMLGANPLIEVNPGLMIWTIICFLVVLFVLKRYAFGPIQQMIDTRRERIQQAIAEADLDQRIGRDEPVHQTRTYARIEPSRP